MEVRQHACVRGTSPPAPLQSNWRGECGRTSYAGTKGAAAKGRLPGDSGTLPWKLWDTGSTMECGYTLAVESHFLSPTGAWGRGRCGSGVAPRYTGRPGI